AGYSLILIFTLWTSFLIYFLTRLLTFLPFILFPLYRLHLYFIRVSKSELTLFNYQFTDICVPCYNSISNTIGILCDSTVDFLTM
ncbi:hypothetical protein L9F63_002747, partial [Diploptera punctata]